VNADWLGTVRQDYYLAHYWCARYKNLARIRFIVLLRYVFSMVGTLEVTICNRDKMKKWQTTSNRSLASCDQFFGLLATSWKWLILAAVTRLVGLAYKLASCDLGLPQTCIGLLESF